MPNAPATSTRALFQQAADLAGVPLRVRGTGMLTMRLAGLFVPEALQQSLQQRIAQLPPAPGGRGHGARRHQRAWRRCRRR